MKSIEYLKDKLRGLHDSCSYLEIKYEYRNYINTHIIEVKPSYCFEDDKQYAIGQISLENEFEELFPDEEILFITENELISVEEPILKIGIASSDCSYELVSSPIKVNYIVDSIPAYVVVEKNMILDYGMPIIDYGIPRERERRWYNFSKKNKKGFEHSSKPFFFIIL